METNTITYVLWYNKRVQAVLRTPLHVSQVYLGDSTMSNYITRTCPICNKEYQADKTRLKHGRQTTCSRECSYVFRQKTIAIKRAKKRESQPSPEVKQCANCGVDVPRTSYRYAKVFCGTECLNLYKAKQAGHKTLKQKKFCVVCGTYFKPRKRTQGYCSRKCFEIAHKSNMTGENNPSYIDGRSFKKTYNAGIKWHDIRKRVYKRDNYTCQECGVKCVSRSYANKYPEQSSNIIQCHHIIPYKISKDNSLDNLVTLCVSCHKTVHERMDNE